MIPAIEKKSGHEITIPFHDAWRTCKEILDHVPVLSWVYRGTRELMDELDRRQEGSACHCLSGSDEAAEHCPRDGQGSSRAVDGCSIKLLSRDAVPHQIHLLRQPCLWGKPTARFCLPPPWPIWKDILFGRANLQSGGCCSCCIIGVSSLDHSLERIGIRVLLQIGEKPGAERMSNLSSGLSWGESTDWNQFRCTTWLPVQLSVRLWFQLICLFWVALKNCGSLEWQKILRVWTWSFDQHLLWDSWVS